MITQHACQHSHVDVISLHDAAEVLVGCKDPVETVVIDVSYNHLDSNRNVIRGVMNFDAYLTI